LYVEIEVGADEQSREIGEEENSLAFPNRNASGEEFLELAIA
jgi:hypothetical protein